MCFVTYTKICYYDDYLCHLELGVLQQLKLLQGLGNVHRQKTHDKEKGTMLVWYMCVNSRDWSTAMLTKAGMRK